MPLTEVWICFFTHSDGGGFVEAVAPPGNAQQVHTARCRRVSDDTHARQRLHHRGVDRPCMLVRGILRSLAVRPRLSRDGSTACTGCH
jgi:hypothetical protein